MRLTYELIVEEQPEGWFVAALDDVKGPLRGAGETPIEAIAALADQLHNWSTGGAERWLDTPAGTKFARLFAPAFEPGKPGGSS